MLPIRWRKIIFIKFKFLRKVRGETCEKSDEINANWTRPDWMFVLLETLLWSSNRNALAVPCL